jgi:hypothetical protein
MDTNIYWTLRGNYEEKKEKLGKWPRDHIEAIILDVTYNNFIRDCCDNNLLALEFGVETPIPIIGSHWRHIEFSCIDKIPIGKSPRMVGFMVKNKWDYPQRYLAINESQNVIDLLDEAIQHNQGENFKEVVTTLWRLRDYMQTLNFQRIVQESYDEGNFTREERYCIECGSEDLAYVERYANGYQYKCRGCGQSSIFQSNDTDE